MNHRYLAGIAAGSLGLVLCTTECAKAAPVIVLPVPITGTDIFYGSMAPTFDSVGDHYLVFRLFGFSPGTGCFTDSFLFTDTNPGNYTAGNFGASQMFVGNGVTQYFQVSSSFSYTGNAPSGFLSYGVTAYSAPGTNDPSFDNFAGSSFSYTIGALANYPAALEFSVGDPITGVLDLNQNIPLNAGAGGAPELDPASSSIPLIVLLGGVAAGGRRRRQKEKSASDKQ